MPPSVLRRSPYVSDRSPRLGWLLAALCLLTWTACAPAPSPVEEAVVDPGPPEPVEGTVTAADGVPIAYEVRGQGEPAVVFVHCWSCNRDFWEAQVTALEAEHRVVAIDLPGHGESGTERETWTIQGLGDDVRAVADELGLERVVLVGHSMGGPVSLDAARRLGDRAAGVVCADTLHNAEFEFPEVMMEMMAGRVETDREAFMQEMIGSMFPEEADPADLSWVVEQALTADPVATAALIRDFEQLDLPAMMRDAGVPLRCINASPGPGRLPTEIEINRQYADYDAVFMDGVGHYLQIERPEEFNRHLAAAVAELAATDGSAPSDATPPDAAPAEGAAG